MDNQTPETIRTATYLAARERLDIKGKLKCNPPNRACGDRCIPPSWKCRVKGEGTDSHSRVVAGDPLAGAASIERGRRRLLKGLTTGNLVDIQGGRAAIARGVVKAVPGQNLKQKQDLRKNIENITLPIAGGLFAAWVVKQGHEGAKVLIPGYAKGLGRDIEEAAGTAIGFVLDRVPIYGAYREAQRENAALQAQVIGRAVRIGVQQDPRLSGKNERSFIELGRQRVSNLRNAIKEGLEVRPGDRETPLPYQEFRSNLLSKLTGATIEGKSVYSEAAAINLIAKQYNVNPSKLTGADNTAKKSFLINEVSSKLQAAATSMRKDMEVRGLDHKKADDVERYLETAVGSATKRLNTLSAPQREEALSALRGTLRELVSPSKSPQPTRNIASNLVRETEKTYDEYFKQTALRIKEDTDPRLRVQVASAADSPIPSVLIGVAERVKGRAGINAPITGANHAELVLQKVYYETAVPKSGYNPKRKSTWSASDFDVKAAAQDLGWDNNGGVTEAYAVLQRSGQFNNLALRPRDTTTRTNTRTVRASTTTTTGKARSAKPRSPAQQIADLMRQKNADGTPRYATREAAEAELKRRRGDDIRIATYLAVRVDFQEGKRLGKPCGASHIPKAHECRKGQATEAPTSQNHAATALKAAVAVVGVAGVVAAYDAYRHFNPDDLPQTPKYRDVVKKERQQAKESLTSGAALARYYDREVAANRLKEGDIVYTQQSPKEASRHFAVYMGKVGENHQFAEIARKQGAQEKAFVLLTEFGPSADKSHYASVYAKAPQLKGEQSLSVVEIKNRVAGLMRTELQYDELDNNCEHWARMIVTNNTRSGQVDKLSVITKSIVRLINTQQSGNTAINLPTVKEQARLLELKKRISEGDFSDSREAMHELSIFNTIIRDRKRVDAASQPSALEGFPSPQELLADSRSQLESIVRIKAYLMLLTAQGHAAFNNNKNGPA